MSPLLEIDVQLGCGGFLLEVAWRTDEPSLGLFGPSGAGKTTLLEILAGTRRGALGVVRVGGRTWLDAAAGVALPPEARGVGYVPQDLLLFPHRDVLGNLQAGSRRAAASARAIDVARVVEVLELGGLERRPVASLSGGERRRVALGRALCSGPELLLLDEPLAGLDAALRDRVAEYLLRVRRAFGLPTLFVSHDVAETRLLSREVAVLSAGRVVRCGPAAEVFLAPDVLPAALHEGFENLLAGTVVALDGGAARVAVEPGVEVVVPAAGLAEGRTVTVGLRAEDLILAVEPPAGLSAQNVVGGVVREVRADGERVLVVVEVGRARAPLVATITARAQARLGLAAGRPAFLVWKAHASRVWA